MLSIVLPRSTGCAARTCPAGFLNFWLAAVGDKINQAARSVSETVAGQVRTELMELDGTF